MFGVGIGLLIYAIINFIFSYGDNSSEFSNVYVVIGIVGIVLMIIGRIRTKSAGNSKRMSHFRCNIEDPVQFKKDAEYILTRKGYRKKDVWEKQASGAEIYSYIKIECNKNTADIYGWIIGPGGEQMNLDGFVGGLYKSPVKKTIKKILSKGNLAEKVYEEKTPLKEARETAKENTGTLSLREVRETVEEFFSRLDGVYYDIPQGGAGVLKARLDNLGRWYPLKCAVDHANSAVIVEILVGTVSGEQIGILTTLIEEYKRTMASDAFDPYLRDDPDDSSRKKFSFMKVQEFESFESREDLMYDKIGDMLSPAFKFAESPELIPFFEATNPPDSI